MSFPAKNVYIFFGEMGAGKNYYGWQFAQNLISKQKVKAASFFDGDWAVTPEILESVQNFQTLTTEMIGKYVKVLAAAIEEELKTTQNLVVAQALYFNSDREWLARYLTDQGYSVKMFWVRPPILRHLRNLLSRHNGWKWIKYWWQNRKRFEAPNYYLRQWFYCYEITDGQSPLEQWYLGLKAQPFSFED